MTTNMVGGGSYTNILDATLPNTLLSLSISNVSGTATLIATNTTFTSSTLTLGTGGRLQLDNLATQTVTTLNLNGRDPTITINKGAKLTAPANTTVFTGISGTTALVVQVSSGGGGSGVWSQAAGTLAIGGVASLQNVMTFDGGGTDGGLALIGMNAIEFSMVGSASSNKLNFINGVLVANNGTLYVGYTNNVGNVLTVDNSRYGGGYI